ncbi:MAG: DUF4265 domain-containing protein [Gammaproteobacteria bacterium]|nr:DUF4265 domain-containing protein [Gammaproteobacteria bacterium]
MAKPKMRVMFELNDELSPARSETLWADYVGQHRYRLRNIPFFVESVSMDDIIYAPPNREGIATFSHVISKGGNRTVRFVVPEVEAQGQMARLEVEPVIEALKSLGCGMEGHDQYLFSANVPLTSCLACVVETLSGFGAVWDVIDDAGPIHRPVDVH